jgi:hypothetical protein
MEQNELVERIGRAIIGDDAEFEERLQADADSLLELVGRLDRANKATVSLLGEAVASSRAAGSTWTRIGAVLGTSKQAAQHRFGDVASILRPQTDQPTAVMRPLHAFNEMSALAEAGQHGWHSVGFGPLRHVVELDSVQWEHRRVIANGADHRRLLKAGWELVGTWFPWAYFTRRTDRPALPQPTAIPYLTDVLS